MAAPLSLRSVLRDAWRRGLRIAFAMLVARPVVRLWLGLNIRHRERLPLGGPAIIVANHNSHLDICTLLSLFPLARVSDVRPAAAADYFMKGGPLTWIARNLVGIVPVVRGGAAHAGSGGGDPLTGCYQALSEGKILIIFPEGTRGEPERPQALKTGVAYLAQRFPEVPVIPLHMYGLGKSMPKGAWIPLPFFVDIFVGRHLSWQRDGGGGKAAFMAALNASFTLLRAKARPTRDEQMPADFDQENT